MAKITVGDKTLDVASKVTALQAIALLGLSKDKVKMLESMLVAVDAGGMSFDAWTTVAQSFQIMPKRSTVEGGWKSILIERNPATKTQIDEVEKLVEKLDEIAGRTKVEGEKDGKKLAGKLTYRVVVNFVADSEKKATAPVATAPATTGGKKK